MIGALGSRIYCGSIGGAFAKFSGVGVFQASCDVSQAIVAGSCICAFPSDARRASGFIFRRNYDGGVAISSGVDCRYVLQFIVGVFQNTSLLSMSLVRGGGHVERYGDFFLVIHCVSGYGSGFVFWSSRFVLRVLTGFWVRYAG